MFSVYTVCFFGHRQIDDFRIVEQRIERLIDKLLNEHEYVEFLVGRDGEFDQLVTSAIRRWQKALGYSQLLCHLGYALSEIGLYQEQECDEYDDDSVRSARFTLTESAIQIRTERWLTVPICAFSALRIRAAVLIKRFDTQKSQVQISSIFLNDSTFRLQFCISV